MKNLILVILLAAFAQLNAQNCFDYYPTAPGEEFTMKTYDKKDRLQSYSEYTVLEASSNKVSYNVEMYDEDDELLQEITFDLLCEDGKVKVDMKSLMSMETLQKMQSDGMEMDIESDYIEFPMENLSVGMELPDAEMTIKVSMENMGNVMTMNSHMHDRKVESTETITIEGKNYNCYKITGTTKVDMGFINSTNKSVTYVSKQDGFVKSESLNKKGKLETYSVLVKE